MRNGGPFRNRGFTLIELLIVVAIIGILSAITTPRLFEMVQSGKQKRTLADIRGVALQLAVYQSDVGFYPRESFCPVDDISYIGRIPKRDGWSQPFYYESDAIGLEYTLVSYGMNTKPDLPWMMGPIDRYRDDLVVLSGSFHQWPDGIQEIHVQ